VFIFTFAARSSIMFLVLTYQLIYIGEQNIEMDKAGGVNLREPRLYIKYHIGTHQYNPLYRRILWQGGMVLGCHLGPASILFITILSPLYFPYPSTISKERMFTNGALTSCPNIERLHYRTCLITDDYLHLCTFGRTLYHLHRYPSQYLPMTQKETAEILHPIRYPEPRPLEFDPEILCLRCLGLVG
jgi:hypothetical protein